MKTKSVAILVYGDAASERNALTEEKYRDLGIAFSHAGFNIESVLYNDESADKLASELLQFNAILVWVNPIEQGNDRKKLDSLLTEVSSKGCFVSAHPDVILKTAQSYSAPARGVPVNSNVPVTPTVNLIQRSFLTEKQFEWKGQSPAEDKVLEIPLLSLS